MIARIEHDRRNGKTAKSPRRREKFCYQLDVAITQPPDNWRAAPLHKPQEWRIKEEARVKMGERVTIYLAHVPHPEQYPTLGMCIENVVNAHKELRPAPEVCAYALGRRHFTLPPRQQLWPEAMCLFPGTCYLCLDTSPYIPGLPPQTSCCQVVPVNEAPGKRLPYLVAFIDR